MFIAAVNAHSCCSCLQFEISTSQSLCLKELHFTEPNRVAKASAERGICLESHTHSPPMHESKQTNLSVSYSCVARAHGQTDAFMM